MTKQRFLTELKEKLSDLPKEDLREQLSFYGEMIDDLKEEGYTEEEAFQKIGSADEVAARVLSEYRLFESAGENDTPKRRVSPWVIVLLVLGSPIWLSLLIVALAVLLSVYITLWSVIISLWAVNLSLAACSLYGFTSSAMFAFQGDFPKCLAMLGVGLLGIGFAVILFFGCLAASMGAAKLTVKIASGIKNLITGRGRNK